MARPINL